MTTATLDPTTGLVTLTIKAWSEAFPVDDLPSKLNLYRGLRDRARGMYASFYSDTVEALEAIAKEVAG